MLYSQADGTVVHRLWVPTTRTRQSRQDWHNTRYSFHSSSTKGFVKSAWLILHPTLWLGIQQTSSTVVHLYNEGRNWAPHCRSISFNDVNSHRYPCLIKSYPVEEGSQKVFILLNSTPTYCRLLKFTLSDDVIDLAALFGMPHAFQVLTRSLQAMCLCQWYLDDLIAVSPIVSY